ncbi:MAG TPA: DUF6350 family protein [Propionibacteriaceae bacterium]|nr:DUF6350 family protein [Propionibacteriaceae bacterium]
MASLLNPRRTNPEVSLRTSDAGPQPAPTGADASAGPPIGWPLAAVACGLVTALAGWVLCAGLAVVGWLAADPGTLAEALGVGTRLWLLANGVSAPIGGLTVTLVPWGATAVVAYMTARSAALTARQVRTDQLAGRVTVSSVLVATYLVPVLAVAVWQGEPWRDPLHWAAVIMVLGLSAAVGAGRALGRPLTDGWPGWAADLSRAVLGAELVLLACGAALLGTGLIRHLDTVTALHSALDPGVAGSIALLLAQLALVPNALVWAASYAMGSGFVMGAGSVVAPAGTELGMLPGLPLLGALPGVGPGDPVLLWWLASGVLAGAAAAGIVVRSRPAARFDASSLVGGLAGVLAAGVFVGLGWAAGGDLGAVRLTDLGPRLWPLLVMAATTMGLAGLLTGVVLGLVRHVRTRSSRSE